MLIPYITKANDQNEEIGVDTSLLTLNTHFTELCQSFRCNFSVPGATLCLDPCLRRLLLFLMVPQSLYLPVTLNILDIALCSYLWTGFVFCFLFYRHYKLAILPPPKKSIENMSPSQCLDHRTQDTSTYAQIFYSQWKHEFLSKGDIVWMSPLEKLPLSLKKLSHFPVCRLSICSVDSVLLLYGNFSVSQGPFY